MNRYGVWISPGVSITGVVGKNSPEFLIEDSMDAIDLDCEDCMTSGDDCYGCETANHTLLIGSWKQDENGKYTPDQSGDYAAISGETYAQVVWSKYTKKCTLYSPCYPGQGDLDTTGDYLTYDLPPDVWGSTEH